MIRIRFFEKKDDQTLILMSVDYSSKVEITREDFGASLQGLSYETLIAMGVRVFQKNGKWEVATLNNE
jgi:hypothetical protein